MYCMVLPNRGPTSIFLSAWVYKIHFRLWIYGEESIYANIKSKLLLMIGKESRPNPSISFKLWFLFGFMDEGYSPLKAGDNCKVNIAINTLWTDKRPSLLGLQIFHVLSLIIKARSLFVNHQIITQEHVDRPYLYRVSKFPEANTNKYSWVWKRYEEKIRDSRLFARNLRHSWKKSWDTELWWTTKLRSIQEYAPEYLNIPGQLHENLEPGQERFIPWRGGC